VDVLKFDLSSYANVSLLTNGIKTFVGVEDLGHISPVSHSHLFQMWLIVIGRR